jgi:hypothetical protein
LRILKTSPIQLGLVELCSLRLETVPENLAAGKPSIGPSNTQGAAISPTGSAATNVHSVPWAILGRGCSIYPTPPTRTCAKLLDRGFPNIRYIRSCASAHWSLAVSLRAGAWTSTDYSIRSGSPICGAGQRLGGLSRSCSAETGLATRAYAFTALIFDKAAPRVCRAGAVNNEIFLAFPAAHELFCSDTYFRVAFPAQLDRFAPTHHWWVARQVLDLCGDHLVFDHPVFIGGRMAHFCDDMARIAPCEAYKKRGWNQGGKS